MNRYNIFNQIHKGLRALLYDKALLTQQTDFLDKKEANATLEQIEGVLELFDKHANTEDSFVLPALADYEPSVVDAFEEEHEKDHILAKRLKELIHVFRISVTADTREDVGRQISVSFVEFMVFNLGHMAKEEKVLNKLLWRYYTDDELVNITKQIMSHTSTQDNSRYSQWILRGLNNPEIAGWLKNVKSNAPEFLFHSLLELTQQTLETQRWLSIREQLKEEVAIVY